MTTTVITEDYVSFEVAKLLKEKGFQAKCTACYHNDQSHTFKLISGRINYCNPKFNKYKMIPPYNAPTLQMVMKWLREEKDVLITYDLAGPFGSKLLVKVYKKDYDLDWIEATTIIRKTLEEAINTAIRWSLENLITN